MADVDNIKSEPMDLNDDNENNKPTEEHNGGGEKPLENGGGVEGESVVAMDTATDTPTEENTTATPTVEMKVEEGVSGTVVQITNVSPGATIQQLATLFGFLGTVTDIRLYPSEETIPPVQVKVCYVMYENNEQCGVAQHLTNTVFIDKALIVVPLNRTEIPEEAECQNLIQSINAYATFSTTGYLPAGFPVSLPGASIPGIPPPPVITHSTDPTEVEEIKRTIFVQDVHSEVSSEQLIAFFSGVGEVKYMRICKKDDATKYAFIEFTASESVPTALQYNGVFFGGMCLKVEHAKSAIVKPESERIAAGRNPLRAGREAVKRPTSANWGMRVINTNAADASPASEDKPKRSRSRSRSRRSGSRGRSKSSRSKARSRSGSRSRRRKSKSKSPRRRSSPVRSKRRSRSRTRSPIRKRRSRSRSRSRTRRRRSRSKSRSKSPRRSKKKSKSRSRSPRRKSRKRSPSKSPDRRKSKSDKDKKDKDDKKDRKDKDKDRKDKDKSDKDKSSKDKDKKEKEKEKEKSPEKELKSLLDKVYNYEQEKEKEKEGTKAE